MKTNGVLLAVMLVLGMTCSLAAQEYVNGYTYVAPSYYLSPPIVTAGPPYVAGVDVYGPTFAPAFQPVQVYQPAPVYQSVPFTVLPAPAYYDAPVGGVYYRERLKTSPREVEYTLKTYGPHGRIQKTEIEWNRRGFEIKQRR